LQKNKFFLIENKADLDLYFRKLTNNVLN